MAGDYKRSKFLAEQVALEFAAGGLPVVIVNPPRRWATTTSSRLPPGKIILDFLKGGMPAYIDTGLNLVDVRDTAEGHLLACERGRTGERYILGCENLTLAQIFRGWRSQRPRRRRRADSLCAVAYAAGVVSTGWARRKRRGAPSAAGRRANGAEEDVCLARRRRARELGFSPGPVDGALKRAVEWFRDNGYC